MNVSVVVPVYNEEGNLPELLARLLAVMDRLGRSYELVFVDDGSRDGSLDILKEAARRHPQRVRVLELSRNFGQHQALLAAFQHVEGDVVVTLEALLD
jgi:undecaprenyl-phosphate 4-deoxy-4-formamido-L-arabinose transferase